MAPNLSSSFPLFHVGVEVVAIVSRPIAHWLPGNSDRFLPASRRLKGYGLAFRSHRWPGWRGPRKLRFKRTGSPIG